MTIVWDTQSDTVEKGDNKRDVNPISSKTYIDDEGFTHYIFSKAMFNNPWYETPQDDLELYEDFIKGGSRSYPSDGNIPCDVIAGELRNVLKDIIECSEDPNNNYCQVAQKALEHGKLSMVRGTLKLYLGKYTTRDWRRKRFTDDIDFWTFQTSVLENSLRSCSFVKNKESGEFEKNIKWRNPQSEEYEEDLLYAANNLNQLLDFGAGSYLEGSSLREIFIKKIKRGHDVDLSDIINVAMVKAGEHQDEWEDAWKSFEEAANTRNSRTTSNLISLCRYAFSIAEHLDRVAEALLKNNDLIFDKSKYPDERIKELIRTSIHWEKYLESNGYEKTREMLHEFYHEQAAEKPVHAENLRELANRLLTLLNKKYEYLKIRFEIESQ